MAAAQLNVTEFKAETYQPIDCKDDHEKQEQEPLQQHQKDDKDNTIHVLSSSIRSGTRTKQGAETGAGEGFALSNNKERLSFHTYPKRVFDRCWRSIGHIPQCARNSVLAGSPPYIDPPFDLPESTPNYSLRHMGPLVIAFACQPWCISPSYANHSFCGPLKVSEFGAARIEEAGGESDQD